MHPPPTPDPQHSTPATKRRDRPNLIDGRLLIAGTALGCVVLFFIVWGSIRFAEKDIKDNRPTLSWAQHERWIGPRVIRDTLVRPKAKNVQYTYPYRKPRYRDPGLVLPKEEEQAVLAIAKRAAAPTFTDASTREQLQRLTTAPAEAASAAVSPNNFYAHYLLATWYMLHGDTPNADAQYRRAFDLAPKVIIVRYTDPAGQPVPNLKLDRIEIGCDRVTDGGETLDQRLVLVYPKLQTDPTGRVYLPVYDTVYRPVYLPQPNGYRISYTPAEGWFRLPTRLGTIHARTLITPP